MADQIRIFHQPLAPIQKPTPPRPVGENVAYGYPIRPSAVVAGWMASYRHRANILNGTYRADGACGAPVPGDALWYVAQVFGRSSDRTSDEATLRV